MCVALTQLSSTTSSQQKQLGKLASCLWHLYRTMCHTPRQTQLRGSSSNMSLTITQLPLPHDTFISKRIRCAHTMKLQYGAHISRSCWHTGGICKQQTRQHGNKKKSGSHSNEEEWQQQQQPELSTCADTSTRCAMPIAEASMPLVTKPGPFHATPNTPVRPHP